MLEAVPPSGNWGRAVPWWQGHTYHGDAGFLITITRVRTSSSSAHCTPNIQYTQVWKTKKYLQFFVFLPGTTSLIICTFAGYFTHILLVFHTFLEKMAFYGLKNRFQGSWRFFIPVTHEHLGCTVFVRACVRISKPASTLTSNIKDHRKPKNQTN
jgi:hypothetical protein